jgi:hypothetical protein
MLTPKYLARSIKNWKLGSLSSLTSLLLVAGVFNMEPFDFHNVHGNARILNFILIESTNEERLDLNNGVLLCYDHDALYN